MPSACGKPMSVPLRGEFRLPRARQYRDGCPDGLLAAGDEFRPVGRFAHGGGRDDAHVLDAEHAVDRMEPAQRLDRALDGVVVEAAGRGDGAAETAQYLLVEERRRAAHRTLVDDEAHGVGPDIDHADRLQVVEPSEGLVAAVSEHHWSWSLPCPPA